MVYPSRLEVILFPDKDNKDSVILWGKGWAGLLAGPYKTGRTQIHCVHSIYLGLILYYGTWGTYMNMKIMLPTVFWAINYLNLSDWAHCFLMTGIYRSVVSQLSSWLLLRKCLTLLLLLCPQSSYKYRYLLHCPSQKPDHQPWLLPLIHWPHHIQSSHHVLPSKFLSNHHFSLYFLCLYPSSRHYPLSPRCLICVTVSSVALLHPFFTLQL